MTFLVLCHFYVIITCLKRIEEKKGKKPVKGGTQTRDMAEVSASAYQQPIANFALTQE